MRDLMTMAEEQGITLKELKARLKGTGWDLCHEGRDQGHLPMVGAFRRPAMPLFVGVFVHVLHADSFRLARLGLAEMVEKLESRDG